MRIEKVFFNLFQWSVLSVELFIRRLKQGRRYNILYGGGAEGCGGVAKHQESPLHITGLKLCISIIMFISVLMIS